MMGIVVCCAVAAVGVDFGWQPVAGGGVEYIIQIEPQMLQRLRAGEDIFSDLPPQAGNIRGYRITVGTALLPHHGEPPPHHPAAAPNVGVSMSPSQPSIDEPPVLDGPLPGPVLGPLLTIERAASNHGKRAAPSSLRGPEAAKRSGSQPAGLERNEANSAESSNQGAPLKRAVSKIADAQQSHQVRRPASAGKPTPATGDAQSQQSGNAQPADTKTPERKSKSTSAQTASPSRPSAASFGLFASLGVNAFLSWVAFSQRTRYRALAKVVKAA